MAMATMKVDEAVAQDFSEEMAEWIEAFDQIVAADRAQGAEVLEALRKRAGETGVAAATGVTTPYCNTIRKEDEVPYPGDRGLERRVEALIRWKRHGGWCTSRTSRMRASADTSPRTLRWRRCWRLASTTSSMAGMDQSRATSSTSRGMRLQASTPGLI